VGGLVFISTAGAPRFSGRVRGGTESWSGRV